MLRSADPQAPGATLVVALVIASLPTSQEQDDMEPPEHSAEIPPEMESLDEGTVTPSAFAAVTTETLPANISFPLIEEDGAQAEFMLMVLVPSILLALLLLSVVFLVIHRKRKRNKREPSSQGSHSALQTNELASENMKVPIFEEDTPSVMEIEMEELDKWMNSMNRNADYEGLPTLEEEKEPNHNSPSDNES